LLVSSFLWCCGSSSLFLVVFFRAVVVVMATPSALALLVRIASLSYLLLASGKKLAATASNFSVQNPPQTKKAEFWHTFIHQFL